MTSNHTASVVRKRPFPMHQAMATADDDVQRAEGAPAATRPRYASPDTDELLLSPPPCLPLVASAAASARKDGHMSNGNEDAKQQPFANGAHAAAAAAEEDDDLLPCEVPTCTFFLAAHEYNEHMQQHHPQLVQQHARLEHEAAEQHRLLLRQYTPAGGADVEVDFGAHSSAAPSLESSILLVPCDYKGCSQRIEIDQYLAHQRQHESGRRAAPFSAQHGHKKYQPLKPLATRSNPMETANNNSPDSPSSRRPVGVSPKSPPSPSDPNFVVGLIPLLQRIFSQRKDLEVHLCSPIQFFFKSKGDGGFGCGYKNIQTMCSALLQFDLYRQVLFDGALTIVASPVAPAASFSAAAVYTALALPRIPPINMLQSYIDVAHQRGYDVIGAAQVGQLRNSKTWIGAVEAHALLCSYGVRSELIDFKSSHVGLVEYVWKYFTERSAAVPTVTKQQKPNIFASAAAGAAASSTPPPAASSAASPNGEPQSQFCPPLYFQHQGHSRSIIGIVHNTRTRRFRLLVLDPDGHGGGAKLMAGLASAHAEQTLKTLYRTEDTLRAKEYQMVLVSSYGLMTHAEQQTSKRPFSTVITALTGDSTASSSSASDGNTRGGLAQPNQPRFTTGHERGSGHRWKMERSEVDDRATARLTVEPLSRSQELLERSASPASAHIPSSSKAAAAAQLPARNNQPIVPPEVSVVSAATSLPARAASSAASRPPSQVAPLPSASPPPPPASSSCSRIPPTSRLLQARKK